MRNLFLKRFSMELEKLHPSKKRKAGRTASRSAPLTSISLQHLNHNSTSSRDAFQLEILHERWFRDDRSVAMLSVLMEYFMVRLDLFSFATLMQQHFIA